MTPSKPITEGQIGKLQELFAARLRKSGLQSEATQQVIATQGDVIADEMVAVVRKYVEAQSDIIVRTVKVNRSRTPREMIKATGRNEYVYDAVDTMPKGEREEVEVHFFKLGRYIPVDELAKEYELRGLKPDHYAQAAVNEQDPAFADEHPNGTQWQDSKGNFCYLTFDRWSDERCVRCNRRSSDWGGNWFFAGVRK